MANDPDTKETANTAMSMPLNFMDNIFDLAQPYSFKVLLLERRNYGYNSWGNIRKGISKLGIFYPSVFG